MPSAGALTIATNPGAVAHSTGGIDLTSAVIGSSVSLVLDTSGGATATDAGDIRLGDLGSSTTGVAGLSLDARGTTSAGLLVVDDQTTGSPSTWYVYSPTGSPRTLDLTKVGGVELLDDFSILTPSGASPVTSVVFPTGAATLNGNGHRLTVDVRGGALGDGNVQLPAHVGGSGSAALASLAVYTGTGTIDLGDATTTGGVSVTVSPAVAGDELRLDGALRLFGDTTMTINSGSAVVGPVVLRNVDGDSTATPRDLTINAGAGAVSIDRVGSAAPGASGIDAWTVTADTLHVPGTVNTQGAIDLRTSTSIALDDDVDSHGRDILLQTNSLTLGGDLTSSTSGGVVTLRPATGATSIGIGASATGTLQLTQALLDKIGTSFSRVDIGYSGAPQQSGNVVVDSGTPGIAVTISGNSLRVYGDAAPAGITLNSALATTGAGNSLELFANSFGVSVAQTVTLSTQSGQLSVHGALRFNSGVTAALDTVTAGGAGGAVSIDGDVLGNGATGVALSVVAGSGGVTIGDATTDKVDSPTSGQTFGGIDIDSNGVITINSSLDVAYAVIG
ncbi:MAG TPA: hypothetical protein PLV92_20820, partial [Pirellulaceae bacterium]|nr:hypothetical protein [Pirellulaceae bacterium]